MYINLKPSIYFVGSQVNLGSYGVVVSQIIILIQPLQHIKLSMDSCWMGDHIKSSKVSSWMGDQIKRRIPLNISFFQVIYINFEIIYACETGHRYSPLAAQSPPSPSPPKDAFFHHLQPKKLQQPQFTNLVHLQPIGPCNAFEQFGPQILKLKGPRASESFCADHTFCANQAHVCSLAHLKTSFCTAYS